MSVALRTLDLTRGGVQIKFWCLEVTSHVVSARYSVVRVAQWLSVRAPSPALHAQMGPAFGRRAHRDPLVADGLCARRVPVVAANQLCVLHRAPPVSAVDVGSLLARGACAVIKTKLSVLLVRVFRLDYPHRWESFFT